MIRKKRTELTVEAERTLVYARRRQRPAAWCPECRAWVELLTAFEAAAHSDVSSYTVCRWAETRSVHFRVTPEGVLLLCVNSLPKSPGLV